MTILDTWPINQATSDTLKLLSTTTMSLLDIFTANATWASKAVLEADTTVVPMANASWLFVLPLVDPSATGSAFMIRFEAVHPVAGGAYYGSWLSAVLGASNSESAASSIFDDADVAGDLTNYEFTILSGFQTPGANGIEGSNHSATVSKAATGGFETILADLGSAGQSWCAVNCGGCPYVKVTPAGNGLGASNLATSLKIMARRMYSLDVPKPYNTGS